MLHSNHVEAIQYYTEAIELKTGHTASYRYYRKSVNNLTVEDIKVLLRVRKEPKDNHPRLFKREKNLRILFDFGISLRIYTLRAKELQCFTSAFLEIFCRF